MDSHPKQTLLLVEDEVIIALSTRMILEKNGYRVVHAKDGESAVAAVAEQHIDLVLMDIDLGSDKMDGTETAEAILQDETLPIIFHTSHSEREMVEKVKGITRYGYVLKNSGEFVLLESIQMAFELFSANQSIQEKEERYQYMFDFNSSGVAVLEAVDGGADFVFVDYNDTGQKLDRITKDEAIGQRVTTIFPGVTEFGLMNVFQSVWSTGEPQSHSNAFYQDDRIQGWRDSFVYRMPSGEIVSVYQDVSREKKLQESLEKAHSIISASNIIAITWANEPGWPVEYVSENVARTLGYRAEELTSGTIAYETLIHPEDIDRVILEVEQNTKDRAVPSFNHAPYRLITKDGSCRWVEDRTVVLRDVDGRIIKFEGVLIDVTERHAAEEKLEIATREIECLYEISKLVEHEGVTLPRILDGTVELVSRYIGQSQSIEFRLTLDNATFGSEKSVSSKAVQQYGIVVSGKPRGKLEVIGSGDFTQEEDQKMVAAVTPVLETISERVGKIIERYEVQEQYRVVSESLHEAIIQADTEGLITFANSQAAELCGFASADELIGTDIASIYDEPERRAAYLSKLKRSDYYHNLEFDLKRKDGVVVPTLANVRQLRDNTGAFMGTLAAVRDVSKLNELTDELRENKEYYETALQSIGDGVAATDRDGNVTLVNRAARELTGDTSEEVTGRPFSAVFPMRVSSTHEPVTDLVAKVLSTGESTTLSNNTELVTKTGRVIRVVNSAAPIRGADGDVNGAVVVFRDETGRYEREEQFRQLFEESAHGIVYHGPDGTVTAANRAAERILGLTSGELSGKTPMDPRWRAIHEDESDYPGETHPAMIALRTGKKVERQIMGVFHPKKNNYVWLSVSSFPEFRAGESSPYRAFTTFEDITEMKMREIEQRKHSHFIEGVFNAIQDSITVIDRDYHVQRANAAAVALFETHGLPVGQKCYEAFYRRTTPCVGCPSRRAFVTKSIAREEQALTLNGEREKTLEIVSFPILDDQGEVDQVVQYCRDISELRRTEKQITQYAKRLDLMMDTADIAWWEMNVQTGSVEFSERKASLLGYEPDRFHQYQDFVDLVHPEDVEQTMDAMHRHMSGEVTRYDAEYRIRSASGAYKWFHDVGTVTERGDDGSPVTVAGIVFNITTQKQINEALRESEAKYRQLITSMNEGIGIVDQAETILFVNPAFARIFGYPENQLIGRSLREFMSDAEYRRIRAETALRTKGDSSEYELVITHRDGGDRVISVKAQPYLHAGAEGTSTLGIVEDVTDRKLRERQLQVLLDERETLLREMNHRVKNNLAMVTSLIRMRELDLDGSVDLSGLRQRIDTIRLMHEHLYQSDDVEFIELQSYVRQILESVVRLADKTIHIDMTDTDIRLPSRIAVDVGLIANELVTNAVKYGGDGTADWDISVEARIDDTTSRCELIVANTGAAFPESVSMDNPETLGLRLISALVSQIGGEIDLVRSPRPVFTVRFPLEFG